MKDHLGFNITNNFTISPIVLEGIRSKVTRWYKCPKCGERFKQTSKEY